ncbi:P-loop containing nucleoside triphosphate hydrolase protein [Zychaea mexicana]|uniref:P-loop containing nucleoside triphosphate hydrolase protein n=1 Tax=Zychaea mexicana TaxID=64656 RepID=UPI0022FDC19E|nr:P-loop containing nucleoside triphosphate hydrolase protein [Zychaea mexicana]KAI9499693.1 P-loop containing nucleoside triphosphate hydrolase protein [Zychaea mexicana]
MFKPKTLQLVSITSTTLQQCSRFSQQLQKKVTFTSTAFVASKRSQLRKPNYSSLTKHIRPDGLTGRERRDVLRAKLKDRHTGGGSRHTPYIPVKNRLETINSALPQQLAKSFDDLELDSTLVQAVQSILPEQAQPTEIQALTIPAVLSTRDAQHILCAAETGSGKTLAYLAPTINTLKQNEKKRRLDRPRAIVLVPTRELVAQVVSTCKSLAHKVKFRSLALDGKTPRGRLVKDLEQPVDVLVTTPTTLRGYVTDRTLSLTDVQYLIVDEADSLFDAGWGDDVKFTMQRLKNAKTIVVSATLPRSVHRTLDDLFGEDGMLKITTPSLHRALPNLKQSFVDLQRFNGNRQLALLDVLKRNIKDEKTLVFCNTRKAAQLLQQWLASKDVNVLALHKDVDRKQTLGLFSGEITSIAVADDADKDANKDKNYNVLISTDIASRGIDTTFVDHVVLYDFPASMIDYLHRVGRTARAGRTGKATSLIGRKDRMMADRIKRSIRDGAVIT